jgi:hypothetical protein
LASRLPPLLRRCLTTLPEDASMGETPAQAGERRFTLQAFWVVSGQNKERRGMVGADSWQGDQLRNHLGHEPLQLSV